MVVETRVIVLTELQYFNQRGTGTQVDQDRKRASRSGASKDAPYYSLAQDRDIEIDQQAHCFASKPHVCQQLSFVNWKNLFDSLQFHEDFILNQQIELISAIQGNTFVNQGQMHLPLKTKPPQVQFVTERFFIGGLKQARP